MKVKIRACSYEGARFRGFESESYERAVKLTLIGDEPNIVVYLRENFSYGDDDNNFSLSTLAQMLKDGDEPVFDGCGAILKIKHKGKVLVDISNEVGLDPDDTEWLNLGEVHVTQENMKDNNHVNRLVKSHFSK